MGEWRGGRRRETGGGKREERKRERKEKAGRKGGGRGPEEDVQERARGKGISKGGVREARSRETFVEEEKARGREHV